MSKKALESFRKPVFLVFLCLLVLIATHGYAAWKRPVEAKTKKGVSITSTGAVNYTTSNRYTTGYVKINNYRNDDWPASHNIGFNREADCWFGGEFHPNFNWDDKGSSARDYNMLHAFYSIYVRYHAYPSSQTANNKFQFTFYENYKNSGCSIPKTLKGVDVVLPFSAGDKLRYVARLLHSGDNYLISLWIYNVTAQTANMVVDAIRSKDCPTTYISHFYIGSGSHGNMYDQIGGPTDSFYGTIDRTIIGKGTITDSQAESWVENGFNSVPTTNKRFDSLNLRREIAIPLYRWTVAFAGSGTVKTAGSSSHWTGTHMVLSSTTNKSDPYDHRIDYNAQNEIKTSELTRKYISFTALTKHQRFYFFVRVQGKNASGTALGEKYLVFSPAYSGTSSTEGYVRTNIDLPLNTYKAFYKNMLDLYNFSTPNGATKIIVKRFVLRGNCAISDIILSNSLSPK